MDRNDRPVRSIQEDPFAASCLCWGLSFSDALSALSLSASGVRNDDRDCKRRGVVQAPEGAKARRQSPSRRPLLRIRLHFPSLSPSPSLQLSVSYSRGTSFDSGAALGRTWQAVHLLVLLLGWRRVLDFSLFCFYPNSIREVGSYWRERDREDL